MTRTAMRMKQVMYVAFAFMLMGAQGCSIFRRDEAPPSARIPGAEGRTYRSSTLARKYGKAYPEPAAYGRKPVDEPPVEKREARTYRKKDMEEPKRKSRWRKRLPALQASATSVSSPKTEAGAYRLKPGDPIVVYLRGIPKEEKIEDVIDEDGYITLPYINTIRAAGKTASELERAIRRAYLGDKIYKDITVNVVVLSRSYYVRGEVRQPGRFPLVSSGVTLVQAIATSGGYTEYANPRKVKVLRGGKTMTIDALKMEQHPEKDMPVEAGDVIVVPRSVF